MGEKSNPPLLLGAGAGIDFLLEFGVEAIAETLGARTKAIAEAAAQLGLGAAPIGIRAPHFLALSFPGNVPAGLMDRLAAEKVFVSQRSQSIRVTPHLYNEPSDWERLIQLLGATTS